MIGLQRRRGQRRRWGSIARFMRGRRPYDGNKGFEVLSREFGGRSYSRSRRWPNAEIDIPCDGLEFVDTMEVLQCSVLLPSEHWTMHVGIKEVCEVQMSNKEGESALAKCLSCTEKGIYVP